MHAKVKRWISAILIAGMITPMLPNDLPGLTLGKVEASEKTQIASAEETIYINSYGGTQRTRDFNDRWKFYDGDAGNDAGKVDYNDSSWKTVNLPHDYSIDRAFVNAGEAESAYLLGGTGWYRKSFRVDQSWEGKRVTIDFDGVYMDATIYLNGKQLGGHPYGYTPFSFELPQDLLKFGAEDNVIAVKVNHITPSSRWYSGSGIYRDVKLTVTDKIHIGRYGIVVTTPNLEDSMGQDGTVRIKTTVANDGEDTQANLIVSHSIKKKGDEQVLKNTEYQIGSLAKDNKNEQTVDLKIENPDLWNSWDKGIPNLYVLHTEIKNSEGIILDQYDTDFGFRYFKFDRDTGFYLNGSNMKLKGVCMHHDQGALGAEAWEASIRRQVKILKEMGCNSIRVTHNPAAEALIKICDEEGMLVIDEAFDGWDRAKNDNSYDYARFFNEIIDQENAILGKEENMSWGEYDLKAMVLRGINSPSIIMWSLGNEIVEGASNYSHYGTKVNDLISWVQEVDNSRKITIGDNKLKENWNLEPAQRIHEAGGIVGFNYAVFKGLHNNGQAHNMIQHEEKGWSVYGSETSSAVNSRGVYEFLGNGRDGATSDRLLSAYDNSRVGWGSLASESWWEVIRYDANAGEYIWTGFDYLGEPTPWNGTRQGYSSVLGLSSFTNAPKSSYFGIIDTAGFPKDSYYLYRSLWREKDTTLHVLPTWDVEDLPGNGSPGTVKVVVYSNAPEVRLYLNEKHIETKKMETKKSVSGWNSTKEGLYEYQTQAGEDKHTALYYTFNVPYEKGTLKAVAYDKEGVEIKQTVGRNSVSTTKGEAKLSLSVDRKEIKADGKDLSYVTIDVQDVDGLFVNSAEPTITLSISGPGKIIGVDNGLQTDHTSYQSLTRKAYRGKLLAIVQSTEKEGDITVTATAAELAGGSIQIKTKEVEQESLEESKYPVSLNLSRIYYVLKGNRPQLSNEVTINYSDGTTEKKQVVWKDQDINIEEEKTNEITGMVDGNIPVTIYVTILDKVTALMNYSTFLRAGEELTLPESRPAIMKDGEILPVYFGVKWNKEGKDFSKPGIYEIQGEADVFGEKMHPTASVRVSAGNVLPGPNVAGAVSEVTSASMEENLAEINNGEAKLGGHPWSARGDVTLRWVTAQNINKIVVYMGDTAPVSDSIKIEFSGGGTQWQEVPMQVQNEALAGMTKRTYSFDTVSAVLVRLTFEQKVKLYEVETYTGIPDFPVGNTAELAELQIDGRLIEESELQTGNIAEYKESVDVQSIKAIGKENAAITILPEYEDEIVILTQSENQTLQKKYTISLGESSASNMEAENSSNDYEPALVYATAPSQQPGYEASKATDKLENTMWHTSWTENLKNQEENRYIQLELKQMSEQGILESLEEPVSITALRYLPRTEESNGRITSYRITYSTTGEEHDWHEVPSGVGQWENNEQWQIANFNEIQAKYIRLYGVETAGDGNQQNQFVSAREIRVCSAQEDLNKVAKVVFEGEEYPYTGSDVCPEPVVTLEAEPEIVLKKDIDYQLSYEQNIEPGQAAVYVRGIGKYRGIIRHYFKITEVTPEIESIPEITINIRVGETPNLPGTIEAVFSGGNRQQVEVIWPDIPQEQYLQQGKFRVKGVVKGTDKIPAAVINVVGEEIVAIEPVAVVMAPNTEPELPEEVTAIKADGSSLSCFVQWQKPDSWPMDHGTVSEIKGIIAESSIEAIARVRMVADTGSVNLAANMSGTGFPTAIAYYSSPGDPPGNANNGNADFDTSSSKQIWCDWESGSVFHENMENNWWGVVFEEKININRVKIGFTEEDAGTGSKVRLPEEYMVQYYDGPDFMLENGNVKDWSSSPLLEATNWKEVVYTHGKPQVPDIDSFKNLVTVDIEPIKTRIIRVCLRPQASNWTGLEEVGVYGYDLTSYDTFRVESLRIGEEEILTEATPGIVYTKRLEADETIPEIAVSVTNNARVLIIKPQGNSGMATITIVPENGDIQEEVVYRINFEGQENLTEIEVISQVTAVKINPSTENNPILEKGKQLQLAAMVEGTGFYQKKVKWSLDGNHSVHTTIQEDTGLLSVDENETASTLTVTATAQGEQAVTASTVITLKAPLTEEGIIGPEEINVEATGETTASITFRAATGIEESLSYTIIIEQQDGSELKRLIGEETIYEIEGLANGKQYVIKIVAVSANGQSGEEKVYRYNHEYQGQGNMPEPEVLPQPQNLRVEKVDEGTANLTYDEIISEKEGVINYRITIFKDTEQIEEITTAETSYLLTNLIEGGNYQIKVTAFGNTAESETSTIGYVHAPKGIWIYNINDSMVYNGTKQVHDLKIYDGNVLLEEKKDYTVSYKNNTNAYEFADHEQDIALAAIQTLDTVGILSVSGEAEVGKVVSEADKKNAPQVSIKMKGNYSGTHTIYFEIDKVSLDAKEVQASDLHTVYSGRKQTPLPTVTWMGRKLTNNKDFEVVEYIEQKNNKEAFVGNESERTTETLTLRGKGNFKGERQIKLVIGAKPKKTTGEMQGAQDILASKLSVSGVKTLPWKEGGVLQENLIVKNAKLDIPEYNENPDLSEYTISYRNNMTVGKATLLVTGTGLDTDKDGYAYIGNKEISFTITGTNMSKVRVEGIEKKYTFTGSAIEPINEEVKVYIPATKNTEEIILEKNSQWTDFTVEYQKNQNKGTAVILLKGNPDKGYTGTKKLTFQIVADSVIKTEQDRFLIEITDSARVENGEVVQMPYSKGGVKPAIKVTEAATNKILELGKDYTVSYRNNSKMAQIKDLQDQKELRKAPTVVVTGKGNYTGKQEVYFEIIAKDLNDYENSDDVTIITKDLTANKKPGGWKAAIKVVDSNGAALNAKDAYLSKAEYVIVDLPEKIEEPEKFTSLEELKEYQEKETNINSKNEAGKDRKLILPAGTKIKVTVQMAENGNYHGFVSTTYRILKNGYDIGKAKIVIKNQAYSGQPVEILDDSFLDEEKTYLQISSKQRVTLQLLREEGEEANIEVVPGSYVNNVYKGTAKVTFRGIGELGGTKTVSFKIGQRSITEHFNSIFKGMINLSR